VLISYFLLVNELELQFNLYFYLDAIFIDCQMPDMKTYVSEDQFIRNMNGVMKVLEDLPPTLSLKICHQYTTVIYYQGLGPL
jgi:hypothetical protein